MNRRVTALLLMFFSLAMPAHGRASTLQQRAKGFGMTQKLTRSIERRFGTVASVAGVGILKAEVRMKSGRLLLIGNNADERAHGRFNSFLRVLPKAQQE